MKRVILIILWLSLCGAVGYYLPTLPLVKEALAIKEVRIKGTDRLKEDDIKDIFKNENWFFISEDRLANKFQRYPFIEDIKLYRPMFGVVDITVVERVPYGLLKFNGSTSIIDINGLIIKDPSFYTRQELSNLKSITLEDRKFDKVTLSKIKTLEESLKNINFKSFIIQKSSIYATTEDNILFVFSRENIEDSIKKAQIFISKEGLKDYKYINVSFESMVIAKK